MIGCTNSSTICKEDEAVVKVKAKYGSTITFLKDNIIIETLSSSNGHQSSEDNNIAYYYFRINKYNFGRWTITTTISELTDSKTIEILEPKLYFVDLSGIIHIYYYGRIDEEITNGFETTSRQGASGNATGKKPTITWGDSYMTWYLKDGGGTLQSRIKIDVTDYNVLDFYAQYTATSDANIRCGIASDNAGYFMADYVTYLNLNRNTKVLEHHALNISNITGSYYLVIAGSRVDVVNSANFYEISLRK